MKSRNGLTIRETIYTSCTLDCPDGCGIRAHVEDGKVVKLEGHSDQPFTRGYRRQHGRARRGPRFQRSWRELSGAAGCTTRAPRL
ncbi:hypothetical protein [Variovorax boronicumulans]